MADSLSVGGSSASVSSNGASSSSGTPTTTGTRAKRAPSIAEYKRLVRRLNVPLPMNMGRRETEHLAFCPACQKAWPTIYHLRSREHGETLDSISAVWVDMPERERAITYQRAHEAQMERFNKIIKCRSLNKFQLFMRDLKRTSKIFKEAEFSRWTVIISSIWRSLPIEEKARYEEEAARLRQERTMLVEQMSPVERRRFKLEKKRRRKRTRVGVLKKPKNAFMVYLASRWARSKESGSALKYRDVMGIASRDWTQLSADERAPFVQEAQEDKARWLEQKRLATLAQKGMAPSNDDSQ